MKRLLLLSIILFFTGCGEYLEDNPEYLITEKDVFGTYPTFQGYLDQAYSFMEDPNKSSITVSANMGGETIARQGWNVSRAAAEGNYLGLLNGRSIFRRFGNAGNTYGWWVGGWTAIRIANQAISNIDLLRGTDQERDLLLGQAYFFRALFHMEIWRAFGSIPYIDEVLVENTQKPRFFSVETQEGTKYNCQAVAERIVEDFEKAAELLPVEWEGAERNWGRITKGAALAYKARALLTAGSPLFNEFSENTATFDRGYMKRAAEAAAEVINLGVYNLPPINSYKGMFARNDGSFPIADEVILVKAEDRFGSSLFTSGIGRVYVPPSIFGGSGITESVTQNYVDKYEMADGSPYDPDGDVTTPSPYDVDNERRWDYRDPRFRATIYVDGDTAGIAPNMVIELFNGGSGRGNGNTLSPYLVHKYWPIGVNRNDEDWDSFYYWTPLMRLAEVYLMYAEAVYEGYGDASASAPNSNLSGQDAVNLVRSRAGMPDAQTTLARNQNYESFRDLVRNERAVELSFEGHYWYDLRRWKVRPDPVLYEMQFDEDYTFFTREIIIPFIFEEKHWWMPFPTNLTIVADDFPQNPGW